MSSGAPSTGRFLASAAAEVAPLGPPWTRASWKRRGVPTVTLITPDLVGLARRTAEARGWPDLRIVTLPQFLDDLTDDEVRILAEEKYEEIMAALTTPIGQ